MATALKASGAKYASSVKPENPTKTPRATTKTRRTGQESLLPGISFEFTLSQRVTGVSPCLLEKTGYSSDELVQESLSNFASSDFEQLSRLIERTVNSPTASQGESIDLRLSTKSGSFITVRGYLLPQGTKSKTEKTLRFEGVDISDYVKSSDLGAQMHAIVENAPINIMLANLDGTIVYINPASRKTLQSIEHLLPIKADAIVGNSFDIFHKNPSHQRRLLADPKNLPHHTEFPLGSEVLSLTAAAIYTPDGSYAGPMVAWEVITDRRNAQKREQEQQAAERAQQETLRQHVAKLLDVVNRAASGDLTVTAKLDAQGAIAELSQGLNQMIIDLREIISQVVEGAAQFSEGSRVVAESAQSLAEGAQTQSASVQQMSASIDELARSIDAVKENAVTANDVAKETSNLAFQGGAAVKKSIEAMEKIKASSTQISEIIQVISEIASQTNLLALNAAIEAARAGEHGLGFAVVADEVRKLAERSSEAAKEISGLIRESTERVEEGGRLSEQTGDSLQRIIQGVETTAKQIAEIANSTMEQAHNASEVSVAIQQISSITEQSAAGSEQMASSSEELGAQANALRELVSRFRTDC